MFERDRSFTLALARPSPRRTSPRNWVSAAVAWAAGRGGPRLSARPYDAEAFLEDPFLVDAEGSRDPGRMDHPRAMARAREGRSRRTLTTGTEPRSTSTTRPRRLARHLDRSGGGLPRGPHRTALRQRRCSRRESAETARALRWIFTISLAAACARAPSSRGTRAQTGSRRSISSRKGPRVRRRKVSGAERPSRGSAMAPCYKCRISAGGALKSSCSMSKYLTGASISACGSTPSRQLTRTA